LAFYSARLEMTMVSSQREKRAISDRSKYQMKSGEKPTPVLAACDYDNIDCNIRLASRGSPYCVDYRRMTGSAAQRRLGNVGDPRRFRNFGGGTPLQSPGIRVSIEVPGKFGDRWTGPCRVLPTHSGSLLLKPPRQKRCGRRYCAGTKLRGLSRFFSQQKWDCPCPETVPHQHICQRLTTRLPFSSEDLFGNYFPS
jgi:hypothetical protein